MPFISSVGYTYRLQNVPKQRRLPADVLIPYYGTSGWSSDWVRYTAADGQFIKATVRQSDIGTINYLQPASITLYSTSSGGNHSAQTFTTTISNQTGGNMYQITSAGGGHNHDILHTYNLSIQAPTQNICFLRSVRPTTKVPINSLIFKANSSGLSGAESFTSSGGAPRYLVGSPTDLTTSPGISSASVTAKTRIEGGHYHFGAIGIFKKVTNTGYMMSYNDTYAGNHDHSVSAAYSQTKINSQLYNLWKLVVAKSPTKDMILMYVGSLSALPSPWYLCNGQNGTVDIRDRIIGYSDGNTWGNLVLSDGYATATAVTTNTQIHTHSSGADIYADRGAAGLHTNFEWNHTHTISATTSQYTPASINVAFIQYKG